MSAAAAQESIGEAVPQRRRFMSIVAALTGVNVAVAALGFISGPLAAHALGPAGRGTLAAIVVPLTLAPTVAALGLPGYGAFASARGRPIGRLIGSLALLALVLGGIGALAAWPLASLLAGDRHVVRDFLVISFAALPVLVFGRMLMGVSSGLERWRLVAAARWVPAVVWTAGVVVLYVAGDLTVVSAATVALLAAASGVLSVTPVLRGIKHVRPARPLIGEGVRFGVRCWIGELAGLVNTRLDQLLMIPLVNERQLGLYAVSVTLAGFPGVVSGALDAVLVPRVAGGDEGLTKRALRMTLASTAVVGLAIAVPVPVVLGTLFGHAFQDATTMARILLAAAIPAVGSEVLTSALVGAGRPGLAGLGDLIAVTLTVVGLIVLLPPLEAEGAALVSLIAYSVTFCYLLTVAKRQFGGSLRSFLIPTAEDVSRVGRAMPLMLRAALRRP